MAKPEPTREVTKRLRKAGFARTDAQDSHGKWVHPLGPTVTIPDGHRTTSPGVVRQVDNVIAEAQRVVKQQKGSQA